MSANEDNVIHRVYPNSLPWITGIAPSYSSTYDEYALKDYISEKSFKDMIRRINGVLDNYWPCFICYYIIGYGLGILTLGLACIFPFFCVRDAKIQVRQMIRRINEKEEIKSRGIEIKLKERCFWRSEIQVLLIKDKEQVQ